METQVIELFVQFQQTRGHENYNFNDALHNAVMAQRAWAVLPDFWAKMEALEALDGDTSELIDREFTGSKEYFYAQAVKCLLAGIMQQEKMAFGMLCRKRMLTRDGNGDVASWFAATRSLIDFLAWHQIADGLKALHYLLLAMEAENISITKIFNI